MPPLPNATKNIWRTYVDLFKQTAGEPVFRPNPFSQKHEWFELHYNNRVLRYAIRLLPGTRPRPDSGYPLYIALHGGGGYQLGNTKSNDLNWWAMANGFYYDILESHVQKTGEGALYVATRGVSTWEAQLPRDTYNLHSQPESYVLLNRMIKGLFLPLPAEIEHLRLGSSAPNPSTGPDCTTYSDPNRVFLLGFSAGGDGVFQLAARMPDLFAAAVAAAGHPNWVKFDNLTNLPLLIQCGETDSTDTEDGDRSGVKDRAMENVRNSEQLDGLESQAEQLFRSCIPKSLLDTTDPKPRPFYPHECEIVQGKGHNAWAQPRMRDTPQAILRNPSSWRKRKLEKVDQAEAATEAEAESDPSHPPPPPQPSSSNSDSDSDAADSILKPINPIFWLSSSSQNSNGARRDPLPRFLVWDLSTRPTEPDLGLEKVWNPDPVPASWLPKRFFYWVFLRDLPSAEKGEKGEGEKVEEDKGKEEEGKKEEERRGRFVAAYDRGSNSIWVSENGAGRLGLLVNEGMLDFEREVNVYVGSSSTAAGTTSSSSSALAGKVRLVGSDSLRNETLWARGDPELVFSAMIVCRKEGEDWIVETTDTLGPEVLQGMF